MLNLENVLGKNKVKKIAKFVVSQFIYCKYRLKLILC